MTLKNYYNRFDPSKNYDKSLFLSGRGLQSAELNEIQDYAWYKIKGIGDATREGCFADATGSLHCNVARHRSAAQRDAR